MLFAAVVQTRQAKLHCVPHGNCCSRSDEVQKEIRRQFKIFLTTFVDRSGVCVYKERISSMCAANKQSLEVSFQHLSNAAPMLAIWVADMPAQMLRLFDPVAEHVVRSEFEECVNLISRVRGGV